MEDAKWVSNRKWTGMLKMIVLNLSVEKLAHICLCLSHFAGAWVLFATAHTFMSIYCVTLSEWMIQIDWDTRVCVHTARQAQADEIEKLRSSF